LRLRISNCGMRIWNQKRSSRVELLNAATRCSSRTSYADLVLRVEVSTLRRDSIWDLRFEISDRKSSLTIE